MTECLPHIVLDRKFIPNGGSSASNILNVKMLRVYQGKNVLLKL